MTWFQELTGIADETPERVREGLSVDGNRLHSLVNRKSWVCGELERPSLAELRDRVRELPGTESPLTVRQVVGDVQQLHRDEENAGSLFQVASQFNLLEMTSPGVTPEAGVGIYEQDHTQGPACAIAAGAGTIFRNYFADVNGRPGQTRDNQIDCLEGIGQLLGNDEGRLWQMTNGYALATPIGLEEVTRKIESADPLELDRLRAALRIGLQWDTQVTLEQCTHQVTQAYCSALPVSYSPEPAEAWAAFAELILEAAYEATLCAAILNAGRTGTGKLYLTLLGGGAFGNHRQWILAALRRALELHSDSGLDVAIVSHGWSNPDVEHLVAELS